MVAIEQLRGSDFTPRYAEFLNEVEGSVARVLHYHDARVRLVGGEVSISEDDYAHWMGVLSSLDRAFKAEKKDLKDLMR